MNCCRQSRFFALLLTVMPALVGGVTSAPAPAAEALPSTEAFEFGARPPQPIFDPNGILPPATLAEIARELDAIRTNDGIDVMVVVLKDLRGAPPEHVARSFGEAWCSPLLHCVVLHVPGGQGGPWIVPGGKLLRRFPAEAVRLQIAAACRRAALEPREDQKVRAAATEASDMLRIWVGDGTYWAIKYNSRLEELRDDSQRHERFRKFLVPTAVGGFVILLGMLYLAVRWFGTRRPRLFPDPHWERRLGAPYAGGNDATLRLSRSSSPHQSPTQTP